MAKHKHKKGDFTFDFSSLTLKIAEKEHAKEVPHLSTEPVSFDNALDLVRTIDITKDYFCFVPGSFIFGDMLEALLFEKKLAPDKMYVTTLGMSRENIDSLVNCTRYLHCKHLYLLVSNYYMGVERHNNVPYLEKEFTGEPIDVAVLASHCKIALIRSHKGDMLISGSANLSSSNNVEQFCIMHDEAAIDYCENKLNNVFERFTVFKGLENKSVDWQKNKGNTGVKAWDNLKG